MEINIVRTDTGLHIYPLPPYLEKYLHYTRRSFETVKFRRVNKFEKIALYSKDEDAICHTFGGFYHQVISLIEKNFDVANVKDNRTQFKNPDLHRVKKLDLRDYQIEDVVRIITANESGIVKAATGWGKTFAAAAIYAAFNQLNTIIATPSRNVFNSMMKKFVKLFPEKHIGGMGAGHKDIGSDLTIATFKSLSLCALEKCELLIVDEIQESTAPVIQDCIASVNYKRVFGLTATDEKLFNNSDKLIKGIYGERLVNIEYDESVEIGAVVPVTVYMLKVPEHIVSARTTEAKIKKGIKTSKIRNGLIGDVIKAIPNKWQSLTFVDTIEDHLKTLLEYVPKDVKYVHRKAKIENEKNKHFELSGKEQDKICEEFLNNEIQHIIATEALSTGTDFPNLRVVILGQGGSSFVALTQKVGRGSRVLMEEDRERLQVDKKTRCIVIDFQDNHDDVLANMAEKREEIYAEHKWEVIKVDKISDIQWTT